MNTTIRGTALAAFLFATASGAAFAAETADLKVTGTIKPSACSISVDGGGIIDFGTIVANTLSDTAATKLPLKNSSFTVTCDAATKVTWATTDNRAGTVNAAAGAAVHGAAAAQFGLGAVDGKNVGAYGIGMKEQPTADGEKVSMIATLDNAATWTTYTTAVARNTATAQAMSWAPTGSTTPSAYKSMTQPFFISLAIGKTGDLPSLTQDIALDGSATITLKYQ